jgi:hypothetical protein
MRIVNLVAYSALVLCVVSPGTSQSAQAPFSLAITAPQATVKGGSEVKVKAILTNTSNRQITFADTSEICDYSVEVRKADGTPAPDTERKRHLDCGTISGNHEIVTLKPDQSKQYEIAVSELSAMSEPGDYTVQVMRKAPKELGGVVVKSNLITVTVAPN